MKDCSTCDKQIKIGNLKVTCPDLYCRKNGYVNHKSKLTEIHIDFIKKDEMLI